MKLQDRNRIIGLTILLLAIPTIAFANAGSPMMWFGMLHSLVLNAFIGWSESEIVKRFNIPNRIWLIIVANYISMIIGLNYIAPHFSSISGNLDFWGGKTDFGDYELKGFIIGMITSYFATLLIEFPFFYFAVKEKLKRKKILLPFFVANTITNILMTAIYYWIVNKGGHW